MAGLEKIIDWSQDKFLWWQDALRRIVEKRRLDETDIEDFVLMCENAHGIKWTEKPAPEPMPISLDDVPDQTVTEENTTLCVIKDVENVNALAKGQVLGFGNSGLTVIYGDNASGKSGYVRILKLICRARGPKPDLRPNILTDSQSDVQKAIIEYKVGDGQPQSFTWEKGESPPNQLRAISVFDSECAVQYVERQNDVAFRPFGLDVLDSLSDVCDVVKAKLEKTKDMISRNPRKFNTLMGDTKVGETIAKLNYDTDPNTIEQLANLTIAEKERLETLRNLILQTDEKRIRKRISEMKLKCDRMSKLKTQILLLDSCLNEEALDKVEKLLFNTKMAKKTARLASKAFSEGEHLKGVGSETWHELWEVARRFSESEAYPDVSFPYLGKNSRCVFCQQKLSEDAKVRMQRFEEFVQGETQNRANKLKRELQMKADAIENMEFDFEIIPGLLEELKFESKELANRFSSFFNYAKAIQREVLTSIKTETWKIAKVLPEVSIEDLDKVIKEIRKKKEDYESAEHPEKLKELEKDYAELSARKRLGDDKKYVLEEINKLNDIKKLDDCIADAHTRTITSFSGELTEKWVKKPLIERFQVELEKLGLNTIKVQLVLKEIRKGEAYHRIEIQGNPGENIAKIVSEGEHRCISLAMFLTELSTATHKSSIVLDDPASSLDHRWRNNIAKRLAEEGKARQVIIFTHDPVFLLMLKENAERLSYQLFIQSVHREYNTTGFCEGKPPWYTMKVKERKGILNRLFQEAEKIFRLQRKDYEYRARYIYGLLRETWERAVEEVLFNKTVLRFRRGIETLWLKEVDIEPSDYIRVDNAMTKCSKFLPGHDDAIELNEPVPEPSELRVDIDDLFNWVQEIKDRR